MPAFALLGDEGRNSLSSAIALPGQPYYGDLADGAAAMFRSLVKNHPFRDGNKRFAVVATNVFLLRNLAFLIITNAEFENIALRTAEGIFEREEIGRKIRERLVDLNEWGSLSKLDRYEWIEHRIDIWSQDLSMPEILDAVGDFLTFYGSAEEILQTITDAPPPPTPE